MKALSKLKELLLYWLLTSSVTWTMTSAWNNDAGLVRSLTKSTDARVIASSSPGDAFKANDGDDSTHWTSGGCLPNGFYLDNPLINVLYDTCRLGRCSSSSDSSDIELATDNSTNTAYHVRPCGTAVDAYVTIVLPSRQSLRHVTVRGSFQTDTQLILVDGSSETVVATLNSSDKYQTRGFNVTLTPATAVTFRSSATFSLFTVGAIGLAGCVERLYVDMGGSHPVRLVRTRHWPGNQGLTSKLIASNDGVTWQTLRHLNPRDLQAVTTILPHVVSLRYVGIEHRHKESDYAKVYVWEIDAYEQVNGIYGDPPAPVPNPASLRQMLGVNAIWGWGWGRRSATLLPGQGAVLYAPLASYARNYHNLDWDVLDPDNDPGYDAMAQGNGTNGQPWLNWDVEYSHWLANNVSVHVTVQFLARTFPVSVWDQPYQAAFNYGRAFARHFGPTYGNGLVRSVEVGNEPWDYPAGFYTTVLDGMASGFRAGDPHMTVMPGAFQAHDPTANNYLGSHLPQGLAGKVDVINSHHYSWRRHDVTGDRVATYPEDPVGSFNEVLSVLRWRDTNTPAKPAWVTEWGWDSPGGGQDCTKFPECTSEAAASAYAARGLLLHARLGVARSTWFFYGNLDECDDHVFCRSGLTSSKAADFALKGPYYVLEHLIQLLGNTHFIDVIREDLDGAYVYIFGSMTSSIPTPTHLVAWRPVDAAVPDGFREVKVDFSYSATPERAWRLRRHSHVGGEVEPPTVHGNRWSMTLTAMPTVVKLTHKAPDVIGR